MRPEEAIIVVQDLCRLAHVTVEALSDATPEPGAAPAPAAHRPVATPLGSVEAAEALARLMPALLEEARLESSPDARQLERTALPLHAAVPRQAHAWANEDGTWFPRHWMRPAARQRVAPDVLRWLQGVVDSLIGALTAQTQAADDQLAALRSSLDPSLPWAQTQLSRVESFVQRRRAAHSLLALATVRLEQEAGRRVVASPQRPLRWPRGAAWAKLDMWIREWSDARRAMTSWLEHIGRAPLAHGELPFLYQRWCALRTVEVLGEVGWVPTTDPAWPILLGGRLELAHTQRTSIELWLEPHIGSRGHPCGLRLSRDAARRVDSLSPDLVLNFATLDGTESVVLDPTLGLDAEHLEGKGRYVHLLERTEPAFVAGVPVTRAPWRAWAMAPVRSPTCEVLRPSGRVGVVPLVPGGTTAPLRAFLGDVTRRCV